LCVLSLFISSTPRPSPPPSLFPYTTLFRSRPDVRHPRRLRPVAGEGARPGHQGDDRPGPEPQLGPPPVVHREPLQPRQPARRLVDRKSTRLNSSHVKISYAVFCLKKKTRTN